MPVNWNTLAAVQLPSASTNPVLKLTFTGNKVYYLKAAGGGARVAFAGSVMRKVGFDRVRGDETILAALKRQAAGSAVAVLKPDDASLIGVGPTDHSLEVPTQDLRTKFGTLREFGA